MEGAQWTGPNGCSVLPAAPPEAQCKPYYSDYSRFRLLVHHLCTSHYLDLFITGVIGLNVVTMAMEHYQQPQVGLSDWPFGPHLIMSLWVKLTQPESGHLGPVVGPLQGILWHHLQGLVKVSLVLVLQVRTVRLREVS